MAYIPLPPPPIGEPPDSELWTDWYNKMSAGPISVISNDLGDINAGSIRGVNVNAASHTTVGSYLTIGSAAAATTLSVRNTTDFSSTGGTGVIIDTLNDRNSFTYTGKTSSTLTGCSGVLAHNVNATLIPLQKSMVIDSVTNEMRFYGNRGDGIVEELASIGISPSGGDFIIGWFGSDNSTRVGAAGISKSSLGLFGQSLTSVGVFGKSSSDAGVLGQSSSNVGGRFYGNNVCGNLRLPMLTTNPTDKSADQFANINGKLCYSDGFNWRRVSDDVIV